MRCYPLLALVLLVGCATTQPSSHPSPEETVRNALDLLCANKVDEAMVLFHVPAQMDAARIRERLADNAKRMATGDWRNQIVEAKAMGKCAVVVVDETKKDSQVTDLDPIYLLHTRDGWRISPQFTRFTALVGRRGEGYREFEKLTKWYKARKDELLDGEPR